MHHKLESPDELQIVQNEFTAEITGIIDSLQQGTHPETGKETRFDKALDRFLELFFIKHAKLNNACYVPLKLPDVSSNLSYLNPDYVTQPHLPADDSNGSEAALPVTKITSDEFWRNITSVHEMARPLRLPDPEAYVVPLRAVDPNQDRLSKPGYSRESMALDAAHFQTKSLARQLVMQCTNPRDLPSSKLSPEIQSLQDTLIRIIDKKAEAGWKFIKQYLGIIAPESGRSVYQYPSVGEMLAVSKTNCDTSQGQHTNNGHPNDGSVNVPLATKRGDQGTWDKERDSLRNEYGMPHRWVVEAYKEWPGSGDTTQDQLNLLTTAECLRVLQQKNSSQCEEFYQWLLSRPISPTHD